MTRHTEGSFQTQVLKTGHFKGPFGMKDFEGYNWWTLRGPIDPLQQWSQTQFPEGHSFAEISSNQLQHTLAWKFLVILKTLIIWIRCVWLGLELNCVELWPSRNGVWDQCFVTPCVPLERPHPCPNPFEVLTPEGKSFEGIRAWMRPSDWNARCYFGEGSRIIWFRSEHISWIIWCRSELCISRITWFRSGLRSVYHK